MNPLFARELRARWRDRRAWWLLLALAIALALLANAMFGSGVSQQDPQIMVRTRNGSYVTRTEQITPTAKAARAGRDLFMALALGNAVAGLLVAPILAATPIARERERGLLESLQLSHMRPLSQIAARTGAALVFLLILQLAITPVYAIILWLGGVSPGEFGLAALILVCIAIGGVAVGTFISARSHRPSTALFSALGFVVLWTLSLWPAAYGAFGTTWGWWSYPASVLMWSHPLPLIWSVTDTSGQISRYLPTPFGWEDGIFVAALCGCWLLASLVLLALATRLIHKPLAPASWESTASAPVQWWRRSIERRDAAARQRELQRKNKSARRVENALVADVPIDKWIRFANPLLEREVRSRFRLRRAGWALMLGRLLLFGAGVFSWMASVYALTDPLGRKDVDSWLIYVLWGLGALAVAALSSASLARERESGTWESLKLSLLRPPEIVRAKWMAPLWAFAIYSAPLWLLLPFGMKWGGRAGMEPLTLLLSVAIVWLSYGTISMVGLLISWRARQPNTALGWVLGLGLILFIAVPILREATDVDNKVTVYLYGASVPRYRGLSYGGNIASEWSAVNFMRWTTLWHPISALNYVQEPTNRDFYAARADVSTGLLVQLAVFVLIVGGGFWRLTRDVGRDKEVSVGG